MSYGPEDIRENYRRMPTEELIELSSQKGDLTPDACSALLSELASRGFSENALAAEDAAGIHDAPSESGDYLGNAGFGVEAPITPSTDLVAVFSAQSEAEAKTAQELLSAAGIESQLQIVVLVAENKSEEALRIVSEKLDNELG